MPVQIHPHEMIALKCSMTMSDNRKAAEIMVYGEIVTSTAWYKLYGMKDSENKSASDFDKMLKEAKSNGAAQLKLRINSPGGIVNQAIAMRTMLLGAPFDEILIYIDGVCASAATLLACIPNARILMAEGSEFMIHNPRNGAYGTAEELESRARQLRVTEKSVRDIYVNHTGQPEATVKEWLEKETSFTAQQAVDAGFANEVYKGEKAVACRVSPQIMEYMQEMYSHIPSNITVCQDPVSPEAPPVTGGVSSENNKNSEEETETMPTPNNQNPQEPAQSTGIDVAKMTMEELRAQNPALFDSVMKSGSDDERQRMQDIDDLTPPGYEAMAMKAKGDGTSALEYHKMLAKAQREKTKQFVEDRKLETMTGTQLPGAASEATDPNAEATMKKDAEDIAAFAKEYSGKSDAGMF